MTLRFDRLLVSHLACILLLASAPQVQAREAEFSADELARIASHGPWPMPSKADPGNHVSGNPAAILLGYRLFFDPRLAANRKIACATCHQPGQGFQDGLATARGLRTGIRNTPGLWNVGQQRWFGWDGGHDNLWSASLRPILDPPKWAATQSVPPDYCAARPDWTACTGKPLARAPMLATKDSW
jgi:cytochrome c peroxidase